MTIFVAVSNKQAHFLQVRNFFSVFFQNRLYPHFLIYKKLSKNELEHARSDQTCFFNVIGGNTSIATKNLKKRSCVQVLNVFRDFLESTEMHRSCFENILLIE